MAWYYGTYSCGHGGRTNIVGPVKNRQWIAERHFSGLCAECYKNKIEEDRRKASEEAAEKAKEMELPELKGSEKQVAWAESLRQKFIEMYEKRIEAIKDIPDDVVADKIRQSGKAVGASLEEINEKITKTLNDRENVIATLVDTLNYVLTNKTDAKWYIDNRYSDPFRHELIEEMEATKAAAIVPDEIVQSAIAEATIYPENAVSNVPTEIKIADDKVSAIYEKNEKFREIVRCLGYSWSGTAWERKISQTTGSAVDRAAELGNKLLNGGFPVTILDNEARKKAIDGTYESECKRWIWLRTTGDHAGKLAITWERGDDLYGVARKLPGAKWDSGAMLVRPEHYEEVEEFARLYGFRFTKAAAEAIEAAKQLRAAAIVVKPAAPIEQGKKDGLKDILNSSNEVLEDLKD